MLIRHVHASGRFTATGNQLKTALNFYAHNTTIRADVIVITEVSPQHLWAPLRDWAKANNWYLNHPVGAGRNEVAILSRKPTTQKRAFRTTGLRLRTARSAPLYLVASQVLESAWFAGAHTPAHTGGLKETGKYAWPTRVYKAMMSGIHAARMRMSGDLAISEDWNLDLDRKEVRDLLSRPYPGMQWGWQPGQKPTEGGRVIDGVLTNMKIIKHSETLPLQGGFDHHAVLTVLETKKR